MIQLMNISKIVSLAVLLAVGAALHTALHTNDYSRQSGWEGWCNTGKNQSPINIPQSSQVCSSISFKIASPKNQVPTGPYDPKQQLLLIHYAGSTMTVGNPATKNLVIYKSLQFHFHVPSEHMLAGYSYDAQLHILHMSASGETAVFGIFLESDSGNFPDLFDTWDIGSARSSFVALPEINTPEHVFHYKGSLTIPPCNQGVQWFISSQPIKVKATNIQKLQKWLNKATPTNRLVQPLNARSIVDIGNGCQTRQFGIK